MFYFIEANSKIIGYSKIYKQAHTVFNCAITDNENKDFTRLYIANQNQLSQGGSIYESKKNVTNNQSFTFRYFFQKYNEAFNLDYYNNVISLKYSFD